MTLSPLRTPRMKTAAIPSAPTGTVRRSGGGSRPRARETAMPSMRASR